MARIRTIKPEFWTDERVGECSVSARLLFLASLNFADDHGGLDRSSKQLKAQAFPYDNIDCEPLVQELLQHRLLIEYEVGGKKYLHIKGFRIHQKVEKPARPRVPVYEDSMRTIRVVGESSPTSSGSSLGREGNGTEGKGDRTASPTPRNGKHREVSRVTDPEWWLDFKLAYPNRAGDQGWRKAQRAAHARMEEGHTAEEFIEGAKRYAIFIAATEKTGTEFVKQACAFLGPDKHFLAPWTLPPNKAQVRQDANISASMQWLADQEAKDAAH